MKFLCSSELIPSGNQKSFYGKAKVETWIKDNKNIFILKSYGIPILVVYKDKLYKASDTYEREFLQTTLKHCREFVRQFADIEQLTKKDLLKLPVWSE